LIDVRHHIYSLAAVFLALAVGIVIGTSFAGRSPSADAGRRTIQRYESDMRALKDEILKASGTAADNEAALKACEQYSRAVMPLAIRDKLYWRNVAIVQTGGSDELTGSVRKALETAGAQITCTVDIGTEFRFADSSSVAEVLSGNGLGAAVDPKTDRDKLFRLIADTICTGRYSFLVPTLEKAGIATFSGNCSRSCKLVVLVGGAESDLQNRAQSVDAQLLARFASIGVTAVGCEASASASSYVPVWHKSGIATVDDADSAMGQTCLVYALNGEIANYGAKPTAERLFPKSLESE
jgi:hypothetical protein